MLRTGLVLLALLACSGTGVAAAAPARPRRTEPRLVLVLAEHQEARVIRLPWHHRRVVSELGVQRVKIGASVAGAPVPGTLRVRWRYPRSELPVGAGLVDVLVAQLPRDDPMFDLDGGHLATWIVLAHGDLDTSSAKPRPARRNEGDLPLLEDYWMAALAGRLDLDTLRKDLQLDPLGPGGGTAWHLFNMLRLLRPTAAIPLLVDLANLPIVPCPPGHDAQPWRQRRYGPCGGYDVDIRAALWKALIEQRFVLPDHEALLVRLVDVPDVEPELRQPQDDRENRRLRDFLDERPRRQAGLRAMGQRLSVQPGYAAFCQRLRERVSGSAGRSARLLCSEPARTAR